MLRPQLNSLIKESKYEYYNVRMTNLLLNNPVKFWRYLQGSRQRVTKIENHGREVVGISVTAKTLNSCLSSVLTTKNRGLQDYKQILKEVPDVQVSQEGIFEALLNLN